MHDEDAALRHWNGYLRPFLRPNQHTSHKTHSTGWIRKTIWEISCVCSPLAGVLSNEKKINRNEVSSLETQKRVSLTLSWCGLQINTVFSTVVTYAERSFYTWKGKYKFQQTKIIKPQASWRTSYSFSFALIQVKKKSFNVLTCELVSVTAPNKQKNG